MNLVARFDALHWSKLGAIVVRVAHLVAAHRVDHRLLEWLEDGLDDDKALAGDAALAAVHHPGSRSDLRRGFDIRVFEDHVGIRSAEFEHALLEDRTRRGGDAASSRDAS